MTYPLPQYTLYIWGGTGKRRLHFKRLENAVVAARALVESANVDGVTLETHAGEIGRWGAPPIPVPPLPISDHCRVRLREMGRETPYTGRENAHGYRTEETR